MGQMDEILSLGDQQRVLSDVNVPLLSLKGRDMVGLIELVQRA